MASAWLLAYTDDDAGRVFQGNMKSDGTTRSRATTRSTTSFMARARAISAPVWTVGVEVPARLSPARRRTRTPRGAVPAVVDAAPDAPLAA